MIFRTVHARVGRVWRHLARRDPLRHVLAPPLEVMRVNLVDEELAEPTHRDLPFLVNTVDQELQDGSPVLTALRTSDSRCATLRSSSETA